MAYISNSASDTLITGTANADDIHNGIYYREAGGTNVTINAGAGDDSIENYGDSVTIDAGAGDDEIGNYGASVSIDTGDGKDRIYNSGARVTIDAGYGNDYIVNYDDSVQIYAGAGNDYIYNSYGDSVTIEAGAGDDSIRNSRDSVTINAGEGNDSIYNGGSSVSIDAGAGDDSIYNSSYYSSATINAGVGNDSIYNGGSSVSIDAGAGDDSIYNYAHRVTIDAGAGNDTIYNNITDRNVYKLSGGSDTIYGYSENDTIYVGSSSYTTAKSGSDFVITSGSDSLVLRYCANLKITVKNSAGKVQTLNSGSSRVMSGSNLNDTILNATSSVTIDTGASNDYIGNSGSSVSIDGGDGDDHIDNYYGSGVSIAAGAGNDSIENYGFSVSIDAGSGNDSIESWGKSVTINAGAGNDSIENYGSSMKIDAGDGADIVSLDSSSRYSASVGHNTISGGTGNDIIYLNRYTTIGNVYVYNSGDGSDTIYDATEYDTISISGASYTRSTVGDDLILSMTGGGAMTLVGAANTAVSIEGTESENGSDTQVGGSDNVENTLDNRIIYGTDGTDALYNDGGNNVQIYGLADNDKIGNNYAVKTVDGSVVPYSGENVTLDGGTGDDEIYSCSPSDHIIYAAGDGNDTVVTYHSAKDYSSGGSLKIHLTSGTFKGARLDSRHHSNLILSVGNGTITLKTGSGLPVSQIPITVLDSSGNEFNFTGEYEIKAFETTVGASATHTASRHNNYYGELVTSPNGSAFIEEGDALKTDNSGNITEIIISDKNHKITTPLNRSALKNVVVKDSTGATIATVRYGVTDIYWDGASYVIEAIDKTAPLAVESAMDNVRIIGSNRADNITSSGKNSVVDSGLGDDSVTTADSTSTIVGGLDNDTIYGSGENIKLTVGSVMNASLKGNDVIITTSRSEKTITVKNAKGKNLTVVNGSNKNLQFTLSKASDTYGDPEVFSEEAEILANTARGELENKVADIMETTASTTSNEALDDLKSCFKMMPGSTLKLDDLPENVFSHIANDIYSRTGASKIGKFNILKTETWVYNVAEAVSTLGATETSVGGYNISINSLIAMGAGSAYITVKNGSKKWEITFQSSKEQLADAIANYATILNELNKDAWWNVITGLVTDLTGTKKPGKYLTYAKNIVSALVDPAGNLSNEIQNVIKKELDITIDGSSLRDFIKDYVPAPYNDIILTAADEYKKIKRLQTNIKADKSFKENAEVYDNLNVAYSAFSAALDGTKVSLPQLSSFGFSGLFAGLKSSAVENINAENTQVTYVDASGETVASATDAIGKFETASDTLIYTALTDDAQDINLGSLFDTNDWLIKTSDESDKIITASNKNATVISGAGNDSVIVSGTGDVVVEAGSGDDVVRIASTAQSIMTVNAGVGNDTIYSNGGSNVFLYQTGDGDDVIHGYDGYNEIQISGSSYSTTTAGNDVIIQVGTGSISLVGAKDKTLNIKVGKDSLPAGISISGEILTASSVFSGEEIDLADYSSVTKVNATALTRGVTIVGSAAKNSMKGGKGADTISGGGGNDTVSLGGGADVYIYSSGNDLIQDYAAADKIKLASASITGSSLSGSDVVLKTSGGNLTVKNGKSKAITVIDASGNETTKTYPESTLPVGISVSGAVLTAGVTFTGNKIDLADYASTVTKVNATALTRGVTIVGSAAKNSIKGGTGADTIYGGAGNDTVSLGGGADVYVYSSGNDLIQDYTAGADKIKLASASITGASLSGSNVVLKTTGGNLTVKNGKGKSITVIDSRGTETTKVYPETSSDTLPAGLSYDSAKKVLTVGTSYGGAAIDLKNYATTTKTVDASKFTKAIKITGTSRAESLVGGSKADTLNGGKGNDTLKGNGGNDVFVYSSGDGADVIADFSTGDKISLASGSVSGASLKSSDMIFKIGSGTLTVKNGKGKEISVGSAIYYDNLIYDAKKTAVTLGSGFNGTLGASDYYSKTKTINAASSTKALNIVGNSQANSIFGGSKADTISGGKGNDTLTGNGGNDVFVYGSGDGKDVIADYTAGTDKIKISSGTISKTAYSGNNVVFTVGSGTLTVKNGKGKKITIVDASGKTTTQTYSGAVSGSSKNAVPWFAEDDNFVAGALDAVLNVEPKKYQSGDLTKPSDFEEIESADTLISATAYEQFN